MSHLTEPSRCSSRSSTLAPTSWQPLPTPEQTSRIPQGLHTLRQPPKKADRTQNHACGIGIIEHCEDLNRRIRLVLAPARHGTGGVRCVNRQVQPRPRSPADARIRTLKPSMIVADLGIGALYCWIHVGCSVELFSPSPTDLPDRCGPARAARLFKAQTTPPSPSENEHQRIYVLLMVDTEYGMLKMRKQRLVGDIDQRL